MDMQFGGNRDRDRYPEYNQLDIYFLIDWLDCQLESAVPLFRLCLLARRGVATQLNQGMIATRYISKI
jgi:hypothetical protein